MRKLGFLLVIGSTNLYYGAETPDFHKYGFSRLGVLTQLTFASLVLLTAVHCLLYRWLETLIELLHHVSPFLIAFSNLIKILLHLGSEVVVHNFLEVFHQKVVYHDSDIGRQQLALL